MNATTTPTATGGDMLNRYTTHSTESLLSANGVHLADYKAGRNPEGALAAIKLIDAALTARGR